MNPTSTIIKQKESPTDVIDSFLGEYQKQRIEFESVERELKKTLDFLLRDAGIMAIASTRIKDTDRLREKLVSRNNDKHYKQINDIYDDIPDLIGGRIALYFPDDIKRIKALIETKFTIESVKSFPADQQHDYQKYSRRFSGYSATHYRVRFIDNKVFRPLIEIQVASLLMHAWSEVEHDLAYKRLKGKVSYEEYETLDEINGLMIAGEISLQRLQRLTKERLDRSKEVSDHYELALFLDESIPSGISKPSISAGDVETLFSYYEKQDRLSKRKVSNDLSHVDYNSDTPISNQLIDLHIDKNLKDSQFIIENKTKKAVNEVEYDSEALGSFMKAWIGLERTVDKYYGIHGKGKHNVSYNERIVPNPFREEYFSLKRVRNEIVHSVIIPSINELFCYVDRIKKLRANIENYNKNDSD